MPINVSCVYREGPFNCKNVNVSMGLMGWYFGRRCVALFDNLCQHQVMHPRPEPPKASVPLPQIAGGKSPMVHLFAAMDPPPTKPWNMVVTCPKCQHAFSIGEMKPMRCIRESDDKPKE